MFNIISIVSSTPTKQNYTKKVQASSPENAALVAMSSAFKSNTRTNTNKKLTHALITVSKNNKLSTFKVFRKMLPQAINQSFQYVHYIQ